MSLPREILKWIQGLDLSHSVRNPKRDFSNGFLVAEILSRYWREVPLHSFDAGSSMVKKADNWQLLYKLSQKRGYDLSQETIQGMIQQRPGCAVALLGHLYVFLTKRTGAPTPTTDAPSKTLFPTVTAAATAADRLDPTPPRRPNGAWALPAAPQPAIAEVRLPSVDRLQAIREEDPRPPHLPKPAPALTSFRQHPTADPVLTNSALQVLSTVCRPRLLLCGVPVDPKLSYFHAFLSRLDVLRPELKAAVWSDLAAHAVPVARCVLEAPGDYEGVVLALGTVFRSLSSTPPDLQGAEALAVAVASGLAALDRGLAATLGVRAFLPWHREELLNGRRDLSLRHALLRMAFAHVQRSGSADRLHLLSGLKECLSTVPHGTHSPASGTDWVAVLPALAVTVTLGDDMPQPLVEFYVESATLGLSLASGTCRAAALAILAEIVRRGAAAPVLQLLDRLEAIAAGSPLDGWEVGAQLGLLCVALLGALLPFNSTGDGSRPPSSRSLRRRVPCGSPAAVTADARAVLRLLPLTLRPDLPVAASRITLTALAPWVLAPPSTFSGPDTALHHEFLRHYVRTLLALPDRTRRAVLGSADAPGCLTGAVATYPLHSVVPHLDPLVATNAIVDVFLAPSDSVDSSPTHPDLPTVINILRAVLAPATAPESPGRWADLLDRAEPTIRAVMAKGGAPADNAVLLARHFHQELEGGAVGLHAPAAVLRWLDSRPHPH
jgi:hypothetical protein